MKRIHPDKCKQGSSSYLQLRIVSI